MQNDKNREIANYSLLLFLSRIFPIFLVVIKLSYNLK